MAAYTRKQYSGAARNTTTTTLLTNVGTTVDITAATGWPSIAGVPFYVVINPSSLSEEKCLATRTTSAAYKGLYNNGINYGIGDIVTTDANPYGAYPGANYIRVGNPGNPGYPPGNEAWELYEGSVLGLSLTLVRAQDDTTASQHEIGSVIYPVFTANDADEANELVSKLTTKGDLLATDGTNLLRLGVGSNGYFLKANSSAAAGIEWGSIPTINNLNDIGDVTITNIEGGDFLVYDNSASAWINETIHFITVSDTVPNDEVSEGDLWYNSNELELYVYYSGVWIQVTDTSGGVQEIYELADVLIEDAVYGQTLVYNGTEWENGLTVASGLATSRTIALSGDVSGSVSFDGSASVSISTTIQPNSVALGSDTTGNYVSGLTQGTGVTVTHTPGEGSSPTVAIGQEVGTSASVTFAKITTTGDVTVGGNITVNGTTTTLNTETLEIEDNLIVLNSNVSASPILNAGIEVERGTSDNVFLRWNETSDKWEITEDGSAYLEIATTTDISEASITSISQIPDVSTAYQIGVTGPAGGIIFITPDTTGNSTGKYFEVAPSASQVQRSWATGANQSLAVSGADQTGIGFGSQNTIEIVAQSGNVAATSAAAYASDYTYGGFSDWFLPSIDELQELYAVEDMEPSTIPGLLNSNYWSSTEHSATHAKYENLGDGGQAFVVKSNASLYVRPVRSFDSPATGEVLKWNGSYWTNEAVGNADTATALETARTIQLSGDVSGSASFDGTENINIYTTVNTASVAIGELYGVNITSPEEFQTLEYNGTQWVNQYASVVSYVRNAEATTITTGTPVYLFGGTGDHATVKRADNSSDTTSSKTVGLVGANIAASQNGPVITRGYVDGVDLSMYSSGDVLWLGKNGQVTTTKPSAPDHLVFIGVVVRATNNGIVYVATQNGYELEELHDVKISGVTDGQFLRYNSASTMWINDTINLGTDTTGDYVTSLVAGTGITLTDNSGEGATPTIAIGQSVATSASVTFANLTVQGVVTLPSGSIHADTLAAGAAQSGFRSHIVTQQGATHTIAASNVGGLVVLSSCTSVVIPTSDATFQIGDRIDFLQTGSQTVVFSATSPQTVGAFDGQLTLGGQYAVATLVKYAANTWVLVGNITA